MLQVLEDEPGQRGSDLAAHLGIELEVDDAIALVDFAKVDIGVGDAEPIAELLELVEIGAQAGEIAPELRAGLEVAIELRLVLGRSPARDLGVDRAVVEREVEVVEGDGTLRRHGGEDAAGHGLRLVFVEELGRPSRGIDQAIALGERVAGSERIVAMARGRLRRETSENAAAGPPR